MQRIGDGDVGAWHREWTATADRLVAEAERSAAASHRVSAREAYLRAATYYRTGYWPLYGTPVDPRLAANFERGAAAFAAAAPLWDAPVVLVEIPYEDGRTLPGGVGRPGERRPATNHDRPHQRLRLHHPGDVLRHHPGRGRDV